MNLPIPINEHKVWRQGGKKCGCQKTAERAGAPIKVEDQRDAWAQLVTHGDTLCLCTLPASLQLAWDKIGALAVWSK